MNKVYVFIFNIMFTIHNSVILLARSFSLYFPSVTATDPVSSNQAVVITLASVAVIALVVLSVVVVIVTIVIVRRYSRSKVVLQVTGDNMDIVGDPSLPSILIHK